MSLEPTKTTHSTNPKDYVFNHTMIRVKDPQASLDFYCKVLGMNLLTKVDFEEAKFSLYFLSYGKPEGTSDEDMRAYAFGNPGTLELTWNWGTEAPDSDFKGYANGNSDPGRGFGHICVAVDNLEEACARFEELGVRFIKKLTDGRMKTIAFIADPDGYWVEVIKRPTPGTQLPA